MEEDVKKHLIKGLMALLILLSLSGCQSNSETVSGQTSQEDPINQEASNQADAETQASDYVLPSDIIRSDSTVVNDSRTKKVITSQESYQIDTRITISIYADEEVPGLIFDEIFYKIDSLEKEISKTIEGSDVSNINESAGIEPVKVSDDVWALIHQGMIYAQESEGKFDLSIGPLVNLWGINHEGAHVPEQDQIDQTIKLIDYHHIILDEDNQTVFLDETGMELDLGAIAKGYIADQVKKVILKDGYENAIINLGGNVLTVGSKPNADSWVIGVRDPDESQTSPLGIMHLNDNSIVTSGVYERFFIEDGIRYHHILNPDTGYPERNGLQSITIVSKHSVQGDGLSTMLFMKGLKEGYAYAQAHDGIDAIFVTDDNKIYVTSGLKDNFELNTTLYKIESIDQVD